MEAVRSSTVKFETVESVVIDGASTIASLGHLDLVDGLLDLVPRDAQRVLISAALTAAVEDLVERRVKRALRYPPEPALPERGPVAPALGVIGYVVTAESAKLDLLAEQLARREEGTSPPIIFCRNDERAAELAERLSMRGFVVGQAGDPEADVAIAAGGVSLTELAEDLDGEVGQTISHDVPGDAATLRARHTGDDDAIVLVEPRELAHLQEIARQANVEARPTPLQRDIPAHSASLQAFRKELRAAIMTEDLTAQFLVLAPLLEEFTAAEVAAAASALLRSRRPATPATSGMSPAAPASPRTGPERSAPAGPAPVTWARLFVGIGSRDEVRPGDLVGTLAGESGVPGSKIGKIEIRDSFSVVEVQADVADRIIQAVNGTTFKGRSVRVDYDRGGPARRPPTRGGNAPRRTTRRPPRE
jgi:ATP-dependent RNA helicase DeaD